VLAVNNKHFERGDHMKAFIGIILLSVGAAACGDDTTSNPAANNGGNNTNNTQTNNSDGITRGENGAINTSAFDGQVVWASSGAVSWIDLATNTKRQVSVGPESLDDLDQLVVHDGLSLSVDGKVVAYTKSSSSYCTGAEGPFLIPFGQLEVVTPGEPGDVLPVDVGDGEIVCRSAQSPSLDATGSSVAYAEQRLMKNGDLVKSDIMFWTRSGEPTRLTTNEAMDFYPILSADGARVVFLSTRDTDSEQEGGLYIMPTDGSAEPTKIDISHPDITNEARLGQLDLPACSNDLSRCVYVDGPDLDHRGAYLVQTDGSGVTRLGEVTNVLTVGISGDGTKALLARSLDGLKSELVLFDLNAPQNGEVIQTNLPADLANPPKLNFDGSLFIINLPFFEPWGNLRGAGNLSVFQTKGEGSALIDSDKTDDEFVTVANFRFNLR